MSEMTIQVQKRERTGKGGSRESRRKGMIPGVVYGSGKDSLPIELDRKSFVDLMKKADSENPIFLLKLSDSGQERHAILRDLQRDPVSRMVIHLDFQRIEMTQKVRVTVPLELVGTPVGVKTEGGLLEFTTRELTIDCLPGDIPKQIDVDVTGLHVGQHLEARNLELPQGVTLHDDPDRVIVTLGHVRTEETAGEGERAEPEVIKRGKTEEA
ncbi:MAG TPA: 50S ribosomal protein L25 [Thermoanaerobaculia bacterium]|nr:50S ribosomal protein L25 [Thermoanaerobaculia bacterium]